MSDSLARLGWQDFEHLLAEHYREQGYRVERHAAVSSQNPMGGGLDLRLRRGNDALIVQCRHWDATEVSGTEVTELMGSMLNEAATGGILVTRGVFSREASAIARRQPRLQMIDGDMLRALLKLPDHLDTSVPLATRASRRAASARKRGSVQAATTSRALPYAVAAAVVILLALFGWEVVGDHAATDPAPSVQASAPAPAPVAAARPATAVAPVPAAPPGRAVGFISHPGPPPGDPPVASHELAERERLRRVDEEARQSRNRGEDAMKVMERNTREVGQSQ